MTSLSPDIIERVEKLAAEIDRRYQRERLISPHSAEKDRERANDLRALLTFVREAEDGTGVVARLICRLTDLMQILRRWEPDYSSAEDNRSIFFANEAKKDAEAWLVGRDYRLPGPVETGRDQDFLTALSKRRAAHLYGRGAASSQERTG